MEDGVCNKQGLRPDSRMEEPGLESMKERVGILDEYLEIRDPLVVSCEEDLKKRFGRTLTDVAPLVPEEEDPTVLFRNNWLARGQAVQLVATSGVGKSSMTVQTAINWAAGKKWLADPMKALKCAIIQAEDSERDVAEQLDGMRWGFTTLHGWSHEKFNEVIGRILCPVCFIGKQGKDFIALLREFQEHEKCDMLFINPVQAFFGGDVGDQEAVSQWTRCGIDPIIKDERHACGAFIVSHTAKFTSGTKEGRANVEDYGEYIGAGSHEWLDWVRAKFVFLKHGKSEDYFDFKAAKRGKRLGWENDLGEATTSKMFKHTEGHIFWQEVTDPDEIARVKMLDGGNGVEEKANDIDGESVSRVMVDWIRKNKAVTARELTETSDAFAGLGLNRRQLRAGGRYIKEHFKDLHMRLENGRYGFSEGFRVAERQRVQQWEIDNTRGIGSGRMDDLPPLPEEEDPWS